MADELDLDTLKTKLEDTLAFQAAYQDEEETEEVMKVRVALQLQEQELRHYISIIEYSILRQNMSRTFHGYETVQQLARVQERQVAADRTEAPTMGGSEPNDMDSDSATKQKDDSKNPSDLAIDECVACSYSYPTMEIYKAPCRDKHAYCKYCLTMIFKNAITDQAFFPPRCCGSRFTLSSVRGYLNEELMHLAERKAIEAETPNPLYCSDPKCAKFIMPDSITGTLAICNECPQRTCVNCKQEYHRGECAPVPDLDAPLLEAAQRAGWRRCFRCHALIELTMGCNHVICRCGAEFCYSCGKQWRTCACDGNLFVFPELGQY